MNTWRMYCDRREWTDSGSIYMIAEDPDKHARGVVRPGLAYPLAFREIIEGSDLQNTPPTMKGSWREIHQFLQAAANLAWEQGIKPSGFESHQSELTAVRYHLEDMRLLAKVKG